MRLKNNFVIKHGIQCFSSGDSGDMGTKSWVITRAMTFFVPNFFFNNSIHQDPMEGIFTRKEIMEWSYRFRKREMAKMIPEWLIDTTYPPKTGETKDQYTERLNILQTEEIRHCDKCHPFDPCADHMFKDNK